ncbi:PTS sugar transporter subunit IIA [Thermophilibacter immobilis]|uniref:PTS sugar transporter subunit IIA n=1 Tax=Thermophilibacter immobilis TaxID=2779519 RepID=A0A7S7M9D6_9ACTN|nr:PTS sugar transporter subunit IIA [Thermophilibacter immobilis]
MVRFVVASHASLARGLVSAVELILGLQRDFAVVELLPGETNTELCAKVDATLGEANESDGTMVFCDLLGGSPFQAFAICSLGREDMRVVYGTNLGMLLEMTVLRNDGASLDEIASKVEEVGRAQIGVLVDQFDPLDDDDF